MRNLVLAVATGAGSGYAPIAPGTAGAGVGLLLYAVVLWGLGWPPSAIPLLAGLFLALGIWAAGRAERILGVKDDGRITVDEIAGMLVALMWLPPRAEVVVTAFVLFRVLDIWKPPPARWAERLGGGVGVMADDLVAGLYANLAGQALWRLALPGGLG